VWVGTTVRRDRFEACQNNGCRCDCFAGARQGPYVVKFTDVIRFDSRCIGSMKRRMKSERMLETTGCTQGQSGV
jgi:hypothetical protein